MSAKLLDEQLYWTQQQIICAIALLALSVVSILLKLTATILLQKRDKKDSLAEANIVLAVAGLGSFIPFCILAIGQHT